MNAEEEHWTFEELVNPEHTAVVVVDMQNDFCSEKGSIAKLGRDLSSLRVMAPVLVVFITRARELGVRLIHTQNVISNDTATAAMRRKRGSPLVTTIKGSWGADWFEEYEEFTPRSGETVIEKPQYSAFLQTGFEELLRDADIRTLVMAGTATNICVESTARDGFMRDFHIVVLSDCTATSFDRKLHEATLENVNNTFGTSCTSDRVIEAWCNRPALDSK